MCACLPCFPDSFRFFQHPHVHRVHRPGGLDAGTQSPETGLPGNGPSSVARIQPAEFRGDTAAEMTAGVVSPICAAAGSTGLPVAVMLPTWRDVDWSAAMTAASTVAAGVWPTPLPAWEVHAAAGPVAFSDLMLTTLTDLSLVTPVEKRLERRFLRSPGVQPSVAVAAGRYDRWGYDHWPERLAERGRPQSGCWLRRYT